MRAAELTLRREDGRVVCESVRVADTTFRRLRGLLGRRSLPPDEGMLLRPAFSIHTWFMRFPIDVVFLDPEQVVVKIEPALAPFRTATCRGAREVIELAAGECERRGLTLGDRVAWAARASWDAGVSAESALVAAPGRQRHGAVVVVSTDPRFAKLVRFLLEGRRVGVTVVAPAEAAQAVATGSVDAVVIDVGADVAAGLRLANALRVETQAPLLLAREEADGAVPGGLPVFAKWDETERLVAELERLAAPDDPSRER